MSVIKLLSIPLDKLCIFIIPFFAVGYIYDNIFKIEIIQKSIIVLIGYLILVISVVFILSMILDGIMTLGHVYVPYFSVFLIIVGFSILGFVIFGVSNTFELTNLNKLDILSLNIFWYLGYLGYGYYLLEKGFYLYFSKYKK